MQIAKVGTFLKNSGNLQDDRPKNFFTGHPVFLKQAFFPRMSESARSDSQFRLTSVHWPLDADFQLPQEFQEQ